MDLLLQDRMYALGAYIFQTTAGQHLKISDSRHT
ncbi:transposase-like protein, partial [Corynebacterium diphtheriae DSM 43988]